MKELNFPDFSDMTKAAKGNEIAPKVNDIISIFRNHYDKFEKKIFEDDK
jgi:hypothetical protein